MRLYTFGKETVPVAGVSMEDGILIIGSVRNKNYKIMLLKLNKEGELEWFKLFGGKNDWEGHSIVKINSDYLIGGAGEGIATPEGGKNWKAYLAKIDGNGNKIWERKYRILGNECVYSIVPLDDGILLGGEVSDGSRRGFFVMKTDLKGNPLWKRTLSSWEDAIFGGLIEGKGSSTLIGSVKDAGWSVITFELDEEGNTIGEKTLGEGIALDVTDLNGKILITGDKNGGFWVSLIGNWEAMLGEGTGTAIQILSDGILVGGELDGSAIVAKLDFDGKLVWKKKLWEGGWVEALGKNIALGVREKRDRMEMAVQLLSY
ncbi:hypothetical protein [Thermococcus paralvinellae]|uniref:Uncharacterized protein n=1 Tax=Thermococcus paralvinellae TaxID=582419 RepID=W0I8B5_9EURY|nr:hypothetical protein [Thermococcus paralvinellae]AHF80663.1 Hypothetical protein TES1_1283 [Thermococcus paralvinellae]